MGLDPARCLIYTCLKSVQKVFGNNSEQIVNNIGILAVPEGPQEVVADTDNCLLVGAWSTHSLCRRLRALSLALHHLLSTAHILLGRGPEKA